MMENKTKMAHQKAAWAVDRARVVMQNLGLSVGIPNHVSVKGPDLFVSRGGRDPFRVEVKLAFFNKGAWRVNRTKRKNDHIMAIVFPSGNVHFDTMKDHIRLCNKSGDRYLTDLARMFE